MSNTTLTAGRLRELLSYEAKTGIWRWRIARKWKGGRCEVNDIAAPKDTRITIDGSAFGKTCLARLYAEPDETVVSMRPGGTRKPEPTQKPRKPRLKESQSAIADRLRSLRVPEHAIARHIEGVRQAAAAREYARNNRHTEQEDDDAFVEA